LRDLHANPKFGPGQGKA